MVATPILQMGLDVEVPPKVEITGAPPPQEQNQLVITVKRDGIYLNTQKMNSPKDLANAFGGHIEADRQPAQVGPRRQPGAGRAAQALDLQRRHHLERVAEPDAGFRLHLDEGDDPATPRDEVELGARAPDVAVEQPVAAEAVPPGGPRLRGMPRRALLR